MGNEFQPVVEDLEKKAKHIGLYLIGSTVATDNEDVFGEDDEMLDKNPDIKALIDNGEASFALMAQFTIGDLAFDDRVQNPTQFETDMEFRRIMPTTAELQRDQITEKLAGGEVSDEDLLSAMFDIEVGDDDDESDDN